MAYSPSLPSMEYDDDDLLDRMTAEYQPPAYPYGLRFDLDEADLKQAAGEGGQPGESFNFAAMAEVCSVFHGKDDSRIELQVCQLAGDDGKFFDIKEKPDDAEEGETWRRFGCISLSRTELEKMDLDGDCEPGDLIHLIGEGCLESVSRSEEHGEVANIQITKLSFEDESEESREG